MTTKEQVLRILLSADDTVSGSDLAARLHISRSAVWKAIEQLRSDGYHIHAATNRGYRLDNGREIFGPEAIQSRMHGGEIGRNIEFHPIIDSTNIRAKKLAAEGAAHGTTVIAEQQNAGHGRFGRNFYSPENSGVYLSVVLRPRIPADQAVCITALAAVAVARSIERTAGLEARIKWVNDVYIGPKKTCGILCEAGLDFESGQMQYVVMGIGVNVGAMHFPGELASIATSLSNECGREISRNAFTAALLDEIEALWPQLETGAFMEEYKERSNVLGRDIVVLRGDERYPARAVDIDRDGSLVIETSEGIKKTLHSGEISVRFS